MRFDGLMSWVQQQFALVWPLRELEEGEVLLLLPVYHLLLLLALFVQALLGLAQQVLSDQLGYFVLLWAWFAQALLLLLPKASVWEYYSWVVVLVEHGAVGSADAVSLSYFY